MRNVELNLTKHFVSVQMDCKETQKTSVLKLDAELTPIVHLMKNVTVFNPSLKPENVQDFVWEIHALLEPPAQLKTTERFVLVIHLWLEMAILNVENVSW